MNFLSKLIFFFNKPKVIVVTGKGKSCTTEAIYQVLTQHFKVRKISDSKLPSVKKDEILIWETKIEKAGILNFLAKHSKLLTLVVTAIGEISFDKDFFAAEKRDTEEILKLVETLPRQSKLVLNFDDKTVRQINDLAHLNTFTFGFQEGADLRATDVKNNGGTNFKINYEGNTVPVWLDKIVDKEQIYATLAAVSVGVIFDLNLVEISQTFKS